MLNKQNLIFHVSAYGGLSMTQKNVLILSFGERLWKSMAEVLFEFWEVKEFCHRKCRHSSLWNTAIVWTAISPEMCKTSYFPDQKSVIIYIPSKDTLVKEILVKLQLNKQFSLSIFVFQIIKVR